MLIGMGAKAPRNRSPMHGPMASKNPQSPKALYLTDLRKQVAGLRARISELENVIRVVEAEAVNGTRPAHGASNGKAKKGGASAWLTFANARIREGKTMKEASALWRERQQQD